MSDNDLDNESNTIKYKDNDSSIFISGGKECKSIIPIIQAICNKIISIEPELTQMDSICGDGDCGIVMKAGAEGILSDINNYNIEDSAILCAAIADTISKSMGGTSGALLELALRAMAVQLSNGENWINAITSGVNAMKFYGGADIGMRTMLDALIPAINELNNNNNINSAAKAAMNGAESTKTMNSLAGRSNYIDKAKLDGVSDPGAYAMAIVFTTAAEFL